MHRTNTVGPRRAQGTGPRSLFSALASIALVWFLMISLSGPVRQVEAQKPPGPTMEDRNLIVRTVIGGLVTPIGFAFPAPRQIFVIAKNTGKVKLYNGA